MSKSAPVERVGGALCKQSSEVREMYRVNECIHEETRLVTELFRMVINFIKIMTCRQDDAP